VILDEVGDGRRESVVMKSDKLMKDRSDFLKAIFF
jgi:hypothetical protein